MQKISVQIVEQLIESEYIIPEYKDAYLYCFDYFFENMKYDFALLCIGILMQRFLITVVFLLFFNLLRYFSGGYHAANALICNILSYSIYALLLLGSYFLSYFDKTAYLFPFVICSLIVFVISPVDHPNKKYDSTHRKRARKFICMLLITEALLFSILYSKGYAALLYAITYSVMVTAMSLLTQSFKNMSNSKKEAKQ